MFQKSLLVVFLFLIAIGLGGYFYSTSTIPDDFAANWKKSYPNWDNGKWVLSDRRPADWFSVKILSSKGKIGLQSVFGNSGKDAIYLADTFLAENQKYQSLPGPLKSMARKKAANLVAKQLDQDQIFEWNLNMKAKESNLQTVRVVRQLFKKDPVKMNVKEGVLLGLLLSKQIDLPQPDVPMEEKSRLKVHGVLEKLKDSGKIDAKRFENLINQPFRFEKHKTYPKPTEVVPDSKSGNHKPKKMQKKQVRKAANTTDFEKKYREDPDLEIADHPDYDPSAFESVEVDEKAEFTVE